MLPAPPSKAAAEHAAQVLARQALTIKAARRAWTSVDPRFISQSWMSALATLLPVVTAAQESVAASGTDYVVYSLAEQGVYRAPEAFVKPSAFAGYAADGRDLTSLLYSPATTAKGLIGQGVPSGAALSSARGSLDRIVKSLLADTSRLAAGADIATRPTVGYVRMLVGKSCPDCVLLAGRYYRWNAGFKRHPGDDCVHVPAVEATAGSVATDPYAHFNAMTEAEQDKFWGKADAQAIRDGADIYQVGNARRGMKKMSAFTAEGTTRHGYAGSVLKPGQRRMTTETIYQLNPKREDAIQALRDQGYILPAGQVAGGSIRGAYYEGFGQMGRGGTRKAASQAMLDARATGVRDPNNRYTMTAAERRFHDAEQRYLAMQQGYNPFVSPGFGNTPDPTGALSGYGRSSADGTRGRPLTAKECAQIESAYRLMLRTRGNYYTS